MKNKNDYKSKKEKHFPYIIFNWDLAEQLESELVDMQRMASGTFI